MKASNVARFQQSMSASLRRPWETEKGNRIWYGERKTGSKRHPLTTKQGNKTFYKGTGSAGYGKLNSAGHFIIDWKKVRTYVVPADLHTTNLKSLVLPDAPQIMQKFRGYEDGFKDPEFAWQNIKTFIEYGPNYSDDFDMEKSGYLQEFVNPKLAEAEQEEFPIIKRD